MPELKFNLKPWQFDFVDTNAKFPALVSAWATGKSLCGILRMVNLMLESENNLGLIVRMEYTDLRDSTIKDFERYTGLKVSETTKEVTLKNRSTIMFRHASELNALQNINLGAFLIEQAEEIPSEEQFSMLMGRLRRPAKRRSGFIIANADGHNWVWKKWIENKDMKGEYPCWEATTYDNKDVLPPDFIDSLKSLPDNVFKRLVLNDHNVAEGLVWPEFNDSHIIEPYEMPSHWKIGFALDHGHNHPTAVIFGAKDYDGNVTIYAEHYKAGELIPYHAEHIKQIEPEYERLDQVIDPTCRFKTLQDKSRSYSVLDAYNELGFVFRPCSVEPNVAISKVGELFKQNKIKIFSSCVNLIDEIKNWKWKPQKPGAEQVKEEPIRIKEDACKALSYLVSSLMLNQQAPIIKPVMGSMAQFEEELNKYKEHQRYLAQEIGEAGLTAGESA
jgi:phage terminase large subunit